MSVFGQSLGFPAFRMEHATPRRDSRYRDKPLWFAFEVGYQHYDQFSYERIIPPMNPQNIYADFLRLHGEGIQHLGIPVDNLERPIVEYEKTGLSRMAVWCMGEYRHEELRPVCLYGYRFDRRSQWELIRAY